MTKPLAWSHSALKTFLACPKQYHEVKVLKNFKDEGSEITRWGERVHKHFELELNGEAATAATDPAFAIYQPIIERFRQTAGTFAAEQELAITSSFRPTGWFSPDVWCRGKLDAMWIDGVVARIVDWKTGKRKPDSNQLKLFGLLAFAHYPELERITTAFVWLQTGKMDVEKFTRKQVPMLWQDILPDVRRLEYAFKTETWIPKPSGLCRNGWCPVTTCTFNEQAAKHGAEVV